MVLDILAQCSKVTTGLSSDMEAGHVDSQVTHQEALNHCLPRVDDDSTRFL